MTIPAEVTCAIACSKCSSAIIATSIHWGNSPPSIGFNWECSNNDCDGEGVIKNNLYDWIELNQTWLELTGIEPNSGAGDDDKKKGKPKK